MAKPKGHKDGCKCVACSPATRRRGQAARKKARKNPEEATRANGTRRKAATGTRKRKAASSRTNPAVVVVQQPAPAPARRTRRKTTRRNPATAAATAPAARTTPCRCPHLPSPLGSGEYLVLQVGSGGKLSPIKAFRTQTDAENHVKMATGQRAVVVRVMSTWGA